MGDSVGDIVAKGQKLYDTLRINLEPRFDGKMLALDIETGSYALGEDSLSAFDTLKATDPDATVYLLRVGNATAMKI